MPRMKGLQYANLINAININHGTSICFQEAWHPKSRRDDIIIAMKKSS